MFTPEELLEIAQYLQPKLHDLLPSDIAEPIAQQLTALITKANNSESVAPQILTLLNQQPALQPYLTGEAPSDILRILPPIPGDMNPVPARSFICPTPDCPETWTRPSSGYAIPICPTHNIQLISAS